MLAASAGCAAYPDGRPIGADAFARFVGIESPSHGCDCHATGAGRRVALQQAHGGNRLEPAGDDSPWAMAAEGREVLAGREVVTDGEVAADGDFIGPYYADAGSGGYVASDGGLPRADPSHGSHEGLAVRTIARLPCQCFSAAANCSVHAAGCGPADIPPPGRFHPVPTQPVFTPRQVPYAVAPGGF